MRIDKNTTIRLGDRNIVKVKLGDVVIWQKSTEPVEGPDYFYIESLGDGNTISLINKGDGSTTNVTPTLEYSTDKNTWNSITFDWTSGEHTTELPVKLNTGGKMYFRNDTRKFSNSSSKYITFLSSVSSNVGGDIRTLSNYLNVNSETTPQTGMFRSLFNNNKNIVDASNLRLLYTTLADYCYFYMFSGCTSLTTAPSLPATTLADYCYTSMFRDCTSLTTAPLLPAITLAIHCYSNMFWGCSKLTTAPALPATTLANNCYYYMFQGCTSLVTAPELPATTLANNCYENMFSSCTSLVTAPTLPSTTLANNCYNTMFYGCTSLTTAPELPAPALANNCYQYMFYGCSSLNSITVYADDISASDCTNNWLKNVASSGTFNNYGSATYTANSPSGIPTGWTEVKPVVGPDYFYIESLGDGNTISVINVGTGNTYGVTPTLEYSTDKNTWNTITFDWTSGNHTTELPVKLNTGKKMYFRNDTRLFSNSNSKYITFSSTVSSNFGGDIRTLSNYLDVNSETKPQTYMFYSLFNNNKYIVDASNLRLPYTTLEDYCYHYMFQGCNSLTTAPALPATTLASSCYRTMFQNCTSLTTAPELPATTLASDCYRYMFYGCKSLTTAPELPATKLASGCYGYMFQNCSKLNNITVYADNISAFSCTDNWLSNVASSGTFRNLGSATYTTDSPSGIPTGWTEVKN